MTLKAIKLQNFKQFEHLSLSCRDVNVLVGPNNSGKSTTLDALRICHDVLRHSARRAPFVASQGNDGVCATYQMDHTQISMTLENVVKDYGDNDAEITLTHNNGNSLVVRLHPERALHAFFRAPGLLPRTVSAVRKAFPLDIVVVPTLGPLEGKEQYVTDETVRRNENTRLAHRNFRNILFRKDKTTFDEFASLISEAWPGVTVSAPEFARIPHPIVEMFYIERRRTREVYWSGFGFQVWMQMMLQVMRGSTNAVLVLDEPDIYLHPDLQRRLLRLVRQRFGQVFLATHSTEIINEANAGDILAISSSSRNARRITSEEGYRDVFNYIGSSENAEFARMARARRIVFFEGYDRRLLRRFAQKVSKSGFLDDPETVFLQAGGFGQWRRVKEVGWTLENVFGMEVKIVAIFDRDYRCDEEVSEFISNINSERIRCHVLGRKEIENYALEREPLLRIMRKRAETKGKLLSEHDASAMIDGIVDSMHEEVRAQLFGHFLSYKRKHDKKLHEASIVNEGMAIFDKRWGISGKRLELVPGKEFLSVLSAKLQDVSGASLTIAQVINEMRVGDVPQELADLITDVELFFRSPC